MNEHSFLYAFFSVLSSTLLEKFNSAWPIADYSGQKQLASQCSLATRKVIDRQMNDKSINWLIDQQIDKNLYLICRVLPFGKGKAGSHYSESKLPQLTQEEE